MRASLLLRLRLSGGGSIYTSLASPPVRETISGSVWPDPACLAEGGREGGEHGGEDDEMSTSPEKSKGCKEHRTHCVVMENSLLLTQKVIL